jgi:dTDP-4-amino-4,6-dideoxygalactose transaminase
MYLWSAFSARAEGKPSESKRAARKVLSLPMCWDLSEADVGVVIEVVRAFDENNQ